MDTLQTIQQAVLSPMMALWAKLIAFIPNLLAAIALLVIGYFLAKLGMTVVSKIIQKIGLNRLSNTIGVDSALRRAGVEKTISDVLGLIIFWLIMLTFIISAADALGLPRVSATVDDFVLYLPKIIAAVLVLMLGLFVAHFARASVRAAAENMNIGYAKPLASTVHGLLFIIVASLSIEQLDIEVTLFNNVVMVVLLAIGVAVALSLGLGTRDIAGNIIAGIYARDLFGAGDDIEIGDTKGKIREVGTTKTIIESAGDLVVTVSNRHLIEGMVSKKTSPR